MNSKSVLRMLPTFFTFFLWLMIIQSGQAQPYIFTTEKVIAPDSLRDFFYNDIYKIYKINLGNDKKDLFGEGNEFVTWDNTQSWVINGFERHFGVVNEYHYGIMSVKDTICFLLDVGSDYFVYSPLVKKLFVDGQDENNDTIIAVYNSLTGAEDTTLNIKSNFGDTRMFFSSDNSILYIPYYDTLYNPERDDKIIIAALSTSTNKIIQTRNLQDLGIKGAYGYSLSQGRNGKAIITSYFKDDQSNYCYNIYDFDKDSSSSFIKYSGIADPYFSSAGKYLIFAERSFETHNNNGMIYVTGFTGKFNVFNVARQKLVKTINLPPKRDVYAFDNYPDNIYYYNDSTEKAITLNIDSLVNSPSGPTDSPKIIMYNLGTTVFTADFINNKIKYERGSGFTIIKPEPPTEDKLLYNEFPKRREHEKQTSADRSISPRVR